MTQYMNTHERSTKILRKCGKRAIADRLMTNVKGTLMAQGLEAPRVAYISAVNVLKPMVTLSSEKRSGQTIQVPAAMSASCQEGKALRILRTAKSNNVPSNAFTTNTQNAGASSSRSGMGGNAKSKDAPVISNRSVRNDMMTTYRNVSARTAPGRSSAASIAHSVLGIHAASGFLSGTSSSHPFGNPAKSVRTSDSRNVGNSVPLGRRNTIHRMAVSQLSASR